MTLYPTLAVLYFTTIFFAGVFIEVYAPAEIFILTLSLFFLGHLAYRSLKTGTTPLISYQDPVAFFGLAFLILVVFQLVPLPPTILGFLSPMSLQIWEKAPLPAGSFFPISIHPYATRQGLVFGLCLLAFYLWVRYGIKDDKHFEYLFLGSSY